MAPAMLFLRTVLMGFPILCFVGVPPGYKYTSGGGMVVCSSGEYFNEWRLPGLQNAVLPTANVDKCTPCGTSIGSEEVEPLGTFTTNGFDVTETIVYVRRNPRSCCE